MNEGRLSADLTGIRNGGYVGGTCLMARLCERLAAKYDFPSGTGLTGHDDISDLKSLSVLQPSSATAHK